MKKYKMTNPLPMQTAGMGAIAGAASTAVTPASALAGGIIGGVIGAVGGGIMKMRDEKASETMAQHPLLNQTQFTPVKKSYPRAGKAKPKGY